MIAYPKSLRPSSALLALLLIAEAHGGATNLATAPLATSSTSSVLPNVMFILDDSGSMDWDFMPDWACHSASATNSSCSNTGEDPSSTRQEYWFRNAGYNGIAYNPAIVYSPPKYYTAGGAVDSTTYPPQNAANTSNWTAVKNDGYGVQISGTSNLTTGKNYFYTFINGGTLQWCNSSALSNCKTLFNSRTGYNYTYAKAPSPRTATLTFSGSTSTSVTNVKINGVEILSAATTASTSATTVAANVVNAINACSSVITGNCAQLGYSASSSGSVVTIYAPGTITTYTPQVTTSPAAGMTVAATAFAASPVAGDNIRTTITSTVDSYPYPGSATKADTRTDCAGTTCTYAEEMTNYANWWAYYRTRMQMTKTAASRAFSVIDSNYRVGLMSINLNTSIYLPVSDFNNAQRKSWYDKFFAANPSNSTPLRAALSAVGRYYGGRQPTYTPPGLSRNVAMNDDPMQYVCQQNFAILSTDGYWNEDVSPKQLDNSTAIGNTDSAEPRPYNDGGSVTYTKSTSQLQQSQSRVFENTSQLQKRIVQTLQRTQQVQQRSVQITQRTVQYQKYSQRNQKCRSDGSSCRELDFDCSISGTGDSGRPRCVQSNRSPASGWTNTSSCTVGASGSNPVTFCRIASDTGFVNVSSCAASNPSSGPTITCGQTDSVVNVSSCTPSGPTNGLTVTCPVADNTINVDSCTPSGPTNGQTITCQTTDTGWVGVGSCTPATSTGSATTCQTAVTGPTAVVSCTPQTALSTNNYLQRSCNTTVVQTGTGVNSCTADPATEANSFVSTNCNTVNSTSSVTSCTAATASAENNWTSTTCSAPTSSGGIANTLADVAEYYYVTDLRARGTASTAPSYCSGAAVTTGATTVNNDVCGTDGSSIQRMVTFTLGLGANGLMEYSDQYAQPSYVGDYSAVKNGTPASAASNTCSWQADGTTCNWPLPVTTGSNQGNDQTTIDDLWHAGVNGRGSYYSARDPATLVTGISSALAGITSKVGASSAATTSNPNVSSGDNYVFSSTFTTIDSSGVGSWYGDLYRQQLNLVSGTLSSTIDWSARNQLDSNTSRTIYTYSPTTTGTKLKSFAWASLSATEQAYFNSAAIAGLSQFCTVGTTCLTTSAQASAAGQNLVNFLRGDQTSEGALTNTSKYYRQRPHLLGDIVNSEAVYVKRSLFNYADTGYGDFAAANTTRQGMVYVGANDGMLHAFNADTGVEAWAYVPALVMPNLWILADKNYQNLHRYFVDGTAVQGEVYFDDAWHTILVGGLNGGGRGYYALDITDPAAPKALWEFSNDNLGYSFGNPEIVKLKDGTWVVLFASGYNNTSPGDGVGRLFVVNAGTGALIRAISTGVGDTTTPSGLAKIRTWVDNASSDNTVQRVYAGDLAGNVWRFDVNNDIGTTGYDATLLATLRDAAGNPQPITSRPEVGSVSGTPMVYIGTGRLLGTPDLSDTSAQSFYAIKDSLESTGIGNPRSTTSMIQQTMAVTTCPSGSPTTICQTGETVRLGSSNTVNLANDNGWYVDLPDSGERINTDPSLALGTLVFTSNVPNTDACNAGGYSFNYFFDYRSGTPVSTAGGIVGAKLGSALATRPVIVRLPNNTIIELVRMSGGSGATTSGGSVSSGSGSGGSTETLPETKTKTPPIGNSGLPTRRISWRELVN